MVTWISDTKHVLCHSYSQMTSRSVPMWQSDARQRLSGNSSWDLKHCLKLWLTQKSHKSFFSPLYLGHFFFKCFLSWSCVASVYAHKHIHLYCCVRKSSLKYCRPLFDPCFGNISFIFLFDLSIYLKSPIGKDVMTLKYKTVKFLHQKSNNGEYFQVWMHYKRPTSVFLCSVFIRRSCKVVFPHVDRFLFCFQPFWSVQTVSRLSQHDLQISK